MGNSSGPEPASPGPSGFFSPLWRRLVPPSLLSRIPEIRNWLLVAVAVRVILMPLAISVDGETTAWIGTVLAFKGQLILSNDPPTISYLTAGMFDLFRPILPHAVLNVYLGGSLYTGPLGVQGLGAATPGFGVFATILKLPYLLCDLGIAFLFLRIGPSERVSMTALKIWVLNPFGLWVSYIIGQYDVIATFFVVLSLYFLLRESYVASGLALGGGILFQLFPLTIVPLFLIFLGRKMTTVRAWVLPAVSYLVPAVVAIATILAFYRYQPVYYQPANLALTGDLINGFFGNVLYNRGVVSQPLVQGIETFLNFTVAFPTTSRLSDELILVALAYFGFLFYQAYGPRITPRTVPALASMFLLVYFAFSLFFVQWFLWVQPFLVLLVASDVRRLLPLYLLLFVSYLVYSFLFGVELWGQTWVIIYPAALNWPAPLDALTNWGLPALLIVNLSRTFFSAACLFFAYLAYRQYRYAEAGLVGVQKRLPW